MKHELETQLYQKYPKIFPIKQWHFWFEHGDGWYDLVDELCGKIQDFIDTNGIQQVEVTQIKEKFGSLRFYYVGGDEAINQFIYDAELASEHICEKCGKPSKITPNQFGWLTNTCETCKNIS
jgi:hypothetical protein